MNRPFSGQPRSDAGRWRMALASWTWWQSITRASWGCSGRGQEDLNLEAAVDASNTFFCEALSPFEMAHRGFREISGYVTRVLQFAAVVSHELRTPLTSLMSSVGMLSEIRDPSPRTDEGRLLANITTSIMILKSRTDDLQDLVGFQSGTLSIKPVEVDLPALLGDILDRMGMTRPAWSCVSPLPARSPW